MSVFRKYSIYRRIIVIVIISFAVQAVLMLGITMARYRSGLKQADATFEALMSKNEQRIDEQFGTVRNIASSVGYASDVQKYLLDLTASERVENYQSLKYLFSLLVDSNPALKAIYIMNDGDVFLENGGYMYMFEQFKVDYGCVQGSMPTRSFFSKIYYDRTEKTSERPYCIYFLPVNTLSSVVHSGSRHIYCAVLFDIAKLLEVSSENVSTTEILSYDGQVLSSTGTLPPQLTGLLASGDSSTVVRSGGQDYYMRSFALDVDDNLLYTFIVPMNDLMGDVKTFMSFSVTMIAVFLLISVALLAFLHNSISQPIRQMIDDMNRLSDSSGIIRPTRAAELNTLSTGINQMLHKLRKMQKQELVHQREYYQMSLEKTRAEMLGYRSQINPHFLFNTLECMCGMARYYGIDALENLTMAMADSYRYVLRAQDYASLEEELAHVRNYMQIMDIRYPGRFHLHLRVDEDAQKTSVLSLILQPLVENAVLHGFVGYDGSDPCTISVLARRDEGRLLLRVEDNGTGISPEHLAQIRERMQSDQAYTERTHIALNNIYKRLRFAYGERGGMEISSEEGRCTRIDIVIPEQ